jgi:hypothetical protein
MRIAWNLPCDANHRNSLQVSGNFTPLPDPGLDDCCVSYTIAFHVAVYHETQALPGAQKNETWAGCFA